ncbi:MULTISPECIES: GNAT family N-acetyltransferase [unclassified Azospirillum]|uniref:GNAT family N-acetyltransferase n=1 Tax=unclassified Azospirillum TaxID=2630922 RepID=UPI000B7320CA|nr:MULTISPECIES: GNAT family N-acetyltransferase [unclassified Azospirillum]SNS58187.1 putative acetyltransferase [Azospirillum sp. RU38E]SNS78000.1 putative acetyltransferase [Azospirillum sp. RU37A]
MTAALPPGCGPARHGPPGLWLRARRVSDADAMAAMTGLPLLRHGTLRPPFPNPDVVRSWLERQHPDDLALVALLDGVLVGSADLLRQTGRRRHCAILGMGVHDDHQGKGIGAALLDALLEAADRWLDIGRVELTVFADNEPALRLYRRFGFVEEGLYRAHAFRDGAYVDAIAMARLRPGWPGGQGA